MHTAIICKNITTFNTWQIPKLWADNNWCQGHDQDNLQCTSPTKNWFSPLQKHAKNMQKLQNTLPKSPRPRSHLPNDGEDVPVAKKKSLANFQLSWKLFNWHWFPMMKASDLNLVLALSLPLPDKLLTMLQTPTFNQVQKPCLLRQTAR